MFSELSVALILSTGITAVCGNNHTHAFFPFFLTIEYNRSPESYVLVNVTISENGRASLLNGLSTNIRNYTKPTSHDIIVHPTMGYFVSSSSPLDAEIRTYVKTFTSVYKTFYQVRSKSDIGHTYYVSTVHKNSEEFMCAALAPLYARLTLNITFPKELFRKVFINDTLIDNSSVVIVVEKGHAVKLNSSFPLRRVILQSTAYSFSVFCAEKNVRYQLRPSNHCGKNFHFSCMGPEKVTRCKISLTSVSSDRNTLTLFNSSGLSKQINYTGYFFSFNLTFLTNNWELQSKNEVCVLRTKYADKKDFIWTKVKAISSSRKNSTTYFDKPTEELSAKVTPEFHPSVVSNYYTKTLETKNMSFTEAQCVCSTGESCNEIQRETTNFSTLEEKVMQIQLFLMVNKSSLNSFIRRKVCAEDERPSSKTLGYIGILVISVCLASIVACDLLKIFDRRSTCMKM